MNELIQQFITDEVTALTYSDLWNFVNSNSICRGTFEGNNHIIMKISSNQFIIYRKKINSMAYQLHLEDIQNILD